MSVPTSPQRAEWQGVPRVPRLGYRNALSSEEAEQLNAQLRENAANATELSRKKSITTNTRTAPLSAALGSKKKSSFLSGIFAKEPTISALATFEADVKAKYGATTPYAVPHVSSRRMPEHVPKVNSKWDGVPESVKSREKDDKRRKRISQQTTISSVPQTGKSYSTNGSVATSQDPTIYGRRNSQSDTNSQAGSWDSRDVGDAGVLRRDSMQSSYSGESQISRERHTASLRSQSLRSPSGSSLPEITCFFPHQQSGTSTVPLRWQSTTISTTPSTQSNNITRADSLRAVQYSTAIDGIPEHSSSPIHTPGEVSPVTPGYVYEGAPVGVESSSESDAGHGRLKPKQARNVPGGIDAFLAGEAKPLTLKDIKVDEGKCLDLPLRNYPQARIDRLEADVSKRPDTSRDRLGLRASVLVATDAVPWETQNTPSSVPPLPRGTNKARVPKALALFK